MNYVKLRMALTHAAGSEPTGDGRRARWKNRFWIGEGLTHPDEFWRKLFGRKFPRARKRFLRPAAAEPWVGYTVEPEPTVRLDPAGGQPRPDGPIGGGPGTRPGPGRPHVGPDGPSGGPAAPPWRPADGPSPGRQVPLRGADSPWPALARVPAAAPGPTSAEPDADRVDRESSARPQPLFPSRSPSDERCSGRLAAGRPAGSP